MAELQTPVVTVSQITQHIKTMLEDGFPLIAVEGELSNVRPSSRGHLYFTLKDEQASISGVLFRGRAGSLSFQPQDGQQVIVHGGLGVYPPRGSYQIIAERMQIAGEGRLLALLEERKRVLAAEGLFDEQRKQPLPLLPRRVAIVTSPTGAAIRDVLQVLSRRNSGLSVTVCPTAVQGAAAADQIARMITIANTHRLGDVIIVTRGGGSLEDLMPFSEEAVVRAIASCELPVISAVGHEIDVALSDLAADLRAPTPSAAAELVSASREELAGRIERAGHAIVASFLSKHRQTRMLVDRFSPDELRRSYTLLTAPLVQRADQAREQLHQAMADRTTGARHQLRLAHERLLSLSPYGVLERGYAVVRTTAGAVVRSGAQVRNGDAIAVQLAHGSLAGRVEEVNDEEL